MWKGRGLIIVCCLLAITGISCLIVGIVYLNKPKLECDGKNNAGTNTTKPAPTRCQYSPEAQRSGLPEFFQKVQETYFELHPEKLATKPGVTKEEYREKLMPYDPSPEKLKQITDKSIELYREIQGKKIAKYKLKPRERKGLAQMLHFLNTSFGTPYDGNYYAGDYLLGPSMFCGSWQAICSTNRIMPLLSYFKLSTVEDVENILIKIKAMNHTFIQFKANMMYGARAGMVRSVHPCQVGVDALISSLRSSDKEQPKEIVAKFGRIMLREDFLSGMSSKEKQKWLEKTGKSVNQSISDHIMEYVGKPIYELTTYLKTTYLEHCAPSHVSSGLASLPLLHIYVNQTKTNETTHPYLPDGTTLNGSLAYKNHILPFFTTTSITPDDVHALGHKMIAKLYSQILELAREYTNETNNDTARDALQEKLNSSVMYYAESEDIPEIESNATAHANCYSVKSAKKNCRVRWEIIQKWFDDINKIMSSLDGKTVDMFYFVGSKHTTPNCPIQPRANFNPNMGVAYYRSSSRYCGNSAGYYVPFFLARPGPKFTEWSVNSHEARPGHHTQVQGNVEHFMDSCGGVIGWLDQITRYTAFVEGWGLYAENPLIAQDTDVYKGKPLAKYGMLRGQLWRALRLVVDTGLHFKKFTRQESLNYFKDYIWDDSDVVQKEITRYQSVPGQATTYMIGQLHLIQLRARAQKELGKKFNFKDFHYNLLKDGSAPLSYLTESIEDYIRCTKDAKGDGCEEVLAVNEEGSDSNMNNALDIDTYNMNNALEVDTYEVIESYY